VLAGPPVTGQREPEFDDYVGARLSALRQLAFVLSRDWHQADDVVQAALTKLYLHWPKARAATSVDAYARTIVIREFLRLQRSSWARLVSVTSLLPDRPGKASDPDAALDLGAALATLPVRQRATLVLRFYCDLSVEQSAQVLGCTPGTVKSQTAKALQAMRRLLGTESDIDGTDEPAELAWPRGPVQPARRTS
jgi:RNA polymerase sigma-70 factor (sigma-E family)